MPRRKLVSKLPRLPSRTIFKPPTSKSLQLLDTLRGIAMANQQEQSQIFYPIRDVARHFHIPASTVARVYDQLEDEGILASVRGSKTLLQGRSSGRHLSVLGFVGMPAMTSLFVTFQEYRICFIRIRRELRRRGFAVATIFFEENDVKTGRLLSRIQSYDVDTVLCYRPDRAIKQVVAQLKDSSMPVVAASDGGLPAIRCRYEVHRESAITSILRDWRSRVDVKSVVIVRAVRASAQEEMLEGLLDEQKLAHEFEILGNQRPREFLESLRAKKQRAIIFPPQAAALFAFRAPESFTGLMKQSRVALTGGPVSIPFAQVPDVSADLVTVDWQLVAEQIVSDLISRKAFDRTAITVFEAQAHFQAPLSQYAQGL